MLLWILLLFVPISAVLAYGMHAPQSWVFLTALAGLAPLADLIRRATVQLARIAGPSAGGLLNVTFGNVPELVLGFIIISAGHVEVVKAQITGAIIGNS